MSVPKGFFKTIITTGIIAGILDLAGAIIIYTIEKGRFPKKILEYIAGGAFGEAAMTGGLQMKLWGLFFQLFIAISFTYFYFLIYPKAKPLHKNIFLSAILYGIFVWAVMNMIIVPLSTYHTPPIPGDIAEAAKAALVLIICIGLPIAVSAKAYYKKTA